MNTLPQLISALCLFLGATHCSQTPVYTWTATRTPVIVIQQRPAEGRLFGQPAHAAASAHTDTVAAAAATAADHKPLTPLGQRLAARFPGLFPPRVQAIVPPWIKALYARPRAEPARDLANELQAVHEGLQAVQQELQAQQLQAQQELQAHQQLQAHQLQQVQQLQQAQQLQHTPQVSANQPLPQDQQIQPEQPQIQEARGPIISYTSDMAVDGGYSYKYETADGVLREEESVMGEGGVATVRGSYSYPSPDGSTVRVSYIADQSGFRTLPHTQ